MTKVAIILTGDPRHIDFCWPWWQGVVEHADYETVFYSTTWEPNPNITNSQTTTCLLYTSPSPRDRTRSRMPSSA